MNGRKGCRFKGKKMKYLLSLTLTLLIVFQAELIHANVPLKNCPAAGTTQTKADMYSAMQKGMVWKYVSGPIIFVDEDNEIKISPVAQTYIDGSQGTFKIGYNYEAKECRRQIILDKEISPGVYDGYLAIELCKPSIMALFAGIKPKDISEVASKNASLNFLNLNDTQKKAVTYYQTDDGTLLPRFKIKLDRIEFKEAPGKCELVTDINNDYQGYAGVGSYYNFNYSFNELYTGQVWTYDDAGNSVYGAHYTGELVAPSAPIEIEVDLTPVIPSMDTKAEYVVHEVDTYSLEKMFEISKGIEYRSFDDVEPLSDTIMSELLDTFQNLPVTIDRQYFTRVEFPDGGDYKCRVFDKTNKHGAYTHQCEFKDGHLFSKDGRRGYMGHFYRSIDGFLTFVGAAQIGSGNHAADMYSKFAHKLPTFGSDQIKDGNDSFGVLAVDRNLENYFLHMHMGSINHTVIQIWKDQKTDSE